MVSPEELFEVKLVAYSAFSKSLLRYVVRLAKNRDIITHSWKKFLWVNIFSLLLEKAIKEMTKDEWIDMGEKDWKCPFSLDGKNQA